MGRPSRYSEAFRSDAVSLVVDSTPPRTIADVAAELGVNRETLRIWVRAAQARSARMAAGLDDAERVELLALRRRVRMLEKEVEALRRVGRGRG